MKKLLKTLFPEKIVINKVTGPSFKPGKFDDSLLLESEGVCHLDFVRVMEAAEGIRYPEKQSVYLTKTILEWLYRLSAQTGDGFQILRTKHFAVLAPSSHAKGIAEFCQSTRNLMVSMFSKLPGNELGYPIAIIAFPSNLHFYYSYVHIFSSDKIVEEAGSGGMFINSPLNQHIVFQLNLEDYRYQSVLAHELSHSFLADLSLPAWVDEGITQNIEETVAGVPYQEVLDIRKLAERNREIWNAENIQRLWDGSAFRIPDTQEFAYFFSRVLVNLIKDEISVSNDEFVQFVTTADWRDAGAEAFEQLFGQPLGVLVEEVLGGTADDWQPHMIQP